MNLTAQQVEWANSTDPNDAAKLMQSLGGDQVLYNQVQNMYGPGGTNYDPSQYGHTASNLAQNISGIPESIRQMYIANGILSPDGTTLLQHQGSDGNLTSGSGVGNYQPYNGPNTGWSGTNASGGFAGGTGTGVSGQNGVTTNGDIYSNWTPTTTTTTPGNSTAGGHNGIGAVAGGSAPAWLQNYVNNANAGVTPGANANTGSTGGLPVADSGTYTNAAPHTSATYVPPDSVKTPFDFFNTPGYNFDLTQGKAAIDNTAAARGNSQSGNTLRELTDYATGLASKYYENAYADYNTDRNFNQGVATDARNYNNANDWQNANFNNANSQWAANFNNNNNQWDTTFNNNNRIDARNFDYQGALADRNFNEMQREWNNNFDYNAATGDRTYNTGTMMDLARLGLAGSQGNGSLASQLAALLSGNTLTGAGAGASATVGGASLISQIISAILGSASNNTIISALKP